MEGFEPRRLDTPGLRRVNVRVRVKGGQGILGIDGPPCIAPMGPAEPIHTHSPRGRA